MLFDSAGGATCGMTFLVISIVLILAIFLFLFIFAAVVYYIIVKFGSTGTKSEQIVKPPKERVMAITDTRSDLIFESLTSDGFEYSNEVIEGIPSFVYKRSDFRAEMFLTQMNLNISVCEVDRISVERLMEFSSGSLDLAIKNNEGLPRGFQSGVFSLAVMISEDVEEEAREFACSEPRKHFAASEMPIVVNTSTNIVHYYQGTPLWGMIYYSTIRSLIKKHIEMQ